MVTFVTDHITFSVTVLVILTITFHANDENVILFFNPIAFFTFILLIKLSQVFVLVFLFHACYIVTRIATPNFALL